MHPRRPEKPLTDGVVALRPWRVEDVPALVREIDGDEEISRWLDMIPQPYTAADGRAYVESTLGSWAQGTGAAFAVIDAGSGALLGSAGMRKVEMETDVAEVGYWTARAARGRGVTTRALRLLSRWLLEEAGAQRVQLRAEVQNVASQRVAEKVGYFREGVLRSCRWNARQRRRMDWVMYSLLPGELP